MELQLTDINVGASNSLKTPVKPSNGSDDSSSSGSFDEQLNQQIDQVKTDKNSAKDSQIQQDSAQSDSENKHPVNDTGDTADAESPSANKDANGEVSEHELGLLESESIDRSQNAGLPLIGIALPLNQPLATSAKPISATPLIDSKFSNDANNNDVNSKNINSKAAELMLDVQKSNIQQTVNNPLSNQAAINTSLVAANNNVLKPINTEMLTNDKVKLQDAHFSKLMNEMPASEMLSQSSRLQQVPITSAIMSSISSAQNMSSINPTADLSGSLSSNLSSSIAANVQSPQWSQQMTQQIALMVKGNFQQAEIKLNPANLGPMEIKLSINDDQASVSFVTQHLQVKEVLDAAMPRLREMLEEQGLDLAESNVSTQAEQQQAEQQAEESSDDDFAENNRSERATEEMDEKPVVVNLSVDTGVSVFA